jgi:hypothetical protein
VHVALILAAKNALKMADTASLSIEKLDLAKLALAAATGEKISMA